MIFLVKLYGFETKTKTRTMEKKIDASEMWIWRRMLRVSWTEKRKTRFSTGRCRTCKRRFVAETEGSKTKDAILWPCDASKLCAKEHDAGKRRGQKKKRPS